MENINTAKVIELQPIVDKIIKLELNKDDKTTKNVPNNKKKGKKSEVYPFEVEDIKKMINYFLENKMFLHHLAFVLSCNMARRVGDMLALKWINFFNPTTGHYRSDILEIQEDKTDKLANPHINSACKEAINLYITQTGCNVAENNYENPVFLQLSGTHKGNTLTDSGYLKALKRAATSVGIPYNVGTHSARKTFGKLSRMLHPNDYDSMELLQTIYNHSDTKTTKHYIGLTKEKIDEYYNDMGNFFTDYITGDKQCVFENAKHIVSIDTNDLRNIIALAYQEGQKNANVTSAETHIDTINDIMSIMEDLLK